MARVVVVVVVPDGFVVTVTVVSGGGVNGAIDVRRIQACRKVAPVTMDLVACR